MTDSLTVSEHLIPKALYASPTFLVGPELISRPSYPTACCSRGISGIDSTAGKVLREASMSGISLVAAVALRRRRPSGRSSAGTSLAGARRRTTR